MILLSLPVPTIQLFENEEIPIVNVDGKYYLPVRAIAKVLDTESDALRRIITRNPELFDGLVMDVMMTSIKGERNTVCLSRDGVLTLLATIDYKRLPDEKKERVIRFRRWMIETVGKVLDGQTPSKPQITAGQIAVDYLNIGHAMHTLYGVPLGIAGVVSLNLAEDASGMDLTAYKRILPPAPEVDTPYLNATQIGARVGLSAAAVNRFLSIQGLIYMGEKGWRMTKEGHEYGGSFPYARNGHTDYQIRWKESVLDLFPGGKQARLEGLAY